jgi:kynureninase
MARRRQDEPMKPLHEYRPQFPILSKTTYLNSNSMGAMPASAEDALRDYARQWAADGVEAWERWLPMITEVADLAGRFFNAEPGSVILNQNVSYFEAAVASCLEFTPRRNKVVAASLEFPTVLYVWERFRQYGAELHCVPSDDGVDIPTQRILDAIDERTVIVPISHSYYVSSAVADIAAIVRKARQVGAYVLADIYQTAGVMPIDVRQWGVDFAVGGSHKWLCGGPGCCYLYVRPDVRERFEPKVTGWFGHAAPFAFEPPPIRYGEGAWRFMGGTPAIPCYFAARAAYRILLEVGVERIWAHNRMLTQRLIDAALDADLKVHTPLPSQRRAGFVGVEFPGADRALKTLVAEGFKLDYRPRCGLRIGPHFYNTPEEIDRLVKRARELAG